MVYNVFNSIEYVYGGGNQATVPGTKVKIYGGNVIGNVFGGGNNADVTAKGTDVSIYGGNILNVYGGNNAANVVGNTNVNIGTAEKVTLSSGDSTYKDQTFDVKGVNITGNVYGGGNAADVTGKTNVKIGK